MRVAGHGYGDGVRSLEVMLESLSGGRRREIQEDRIVMEVKKIFKCSRRSWNELGEAKCDLVRHADCRWVNDSECAALNGFQWLGLGLGETVMPNGRTVFKNRSYDYVLMRTICSGVIFSMNKLDFRQVNKYICGKLDFVHMYDRHRLRFLYKFSISQSVIVVFLFPTVSNSYLQNIISLLISLRIL